MVGVQTKFTAPHARIIYREPCPKQRNTAKDKNAQRSRPPTARFVVHRKRVLLPLPVVVPEATTLRRAGAALVQRRMKQPAAAEAPAALIDRRRRPDGWIHCPCSLPLDTSVSVVSRTSSLAGLHRSSPWPLHLQGCRHSRAGSQRPTNQPIADGHAPHRLTQRRSYLEHVEGLDHHVSPLRAAEHLPSSPPTRTSLKQSDGQRKARTVASPASPHLVASPSQRPKLLHPGRELPAGLRGVVL
jgi:hypothetical protein